MPNRDTTETLAARTIADFGEQWTTFTDNAGFYGSPDLFRDICGPLLSDADIRGRTVAEIGSGTGRIVHMLMHAGAAHVVALEPSEAFDVLTANVRQFGDRVECLRTTGDRLPSATRVDLVLSVGVLHHIPDPEPVVRAAYEALLPGGRMLVWLYGQEGNGWYLRLARPLRAVTTRLPHAPVLRLSKILNAGLKVYIACCRRAPLPLRDYLLQVFDRMDDRKRVVIIYDQLRPAYSRYYTRREAVELLSSAGFAEVRTHHRHGYSWTVLGTKPAPA
jgi:SAM-dependent methyltransferase